MHRLQTTFLKTMNKQLIFLSVLGLVACSPKPKNDAPTASKEVAQAPKVQLRTEQPVYRATETVKTDLVHTKLEVSFDWSKAWMYGKETLTAKPHFYASNELVLDAKGMTINSVTMNGKALVFTYKDDVLTITLDKTYKKDENYTLVIDYIARPNERTIGGSAAIASDKGLYFINPKGEDPSKMPQIWTQGETEASSVWFPTIDAPNSKTTQEIFMTVDNKYVTLSNGKMISSTKNANGTRTDHWKQELPHAPYLFMMGVGEFKVVKDFYKRQNGTDMEVNYYVEPEWEQYAKAIFGETPAMIAYFSKLLGVEYPWDKYSQIVVRDYVSGAMENTGAVVFGDYAYKSDRDLLDANDQSTIAHELFHHWFGDLVTAESWSNLTLNESFANYSQYLWDEHRFGKDEADYQAEQEANGYRQSANQAGYHNLVWFDYKDKEEMFDGHSYNKGGRILHMLRTYLGDEAFFQGIQLYLKTNSFQAAEFHQLRLAFEKVSGEDLNWFFNQWYLGKGHPNLTVKQSVDNAGKKAIIDISQNQDLNEFPLFQLPMDLVVYDDRGATEVRLWVKNKTEKLEVPFVGTLKNVLINQTGALLADISEEKEATQYIHQYYNGKRYNARKEALLQVVKLKPEGFEKVILDALKDPFWDLRSIALEKFSKLKEPNKSLGVDLARKMAVSDSVSSVRAGAIGVLSTNLNPTIYKSVLEERIATDKSYTVISTALLQLSKLDKDRAMILAKGLETEKSTRLLSGIARLYGANGGADQYAFFERIFKENKLQGYEAIGALNSFTNYLTKQPLEMQRKAMALYNYQADNGGIYMKMFMPQQMNFLIENVTKMIETLKADEEKERKAGNTNAAEIAKQKLGDAESLTKMMKELQARTATRN